jgi:hypothetical protein
MPAPAQPDRRPPPETERVALRIHDPELGRIPFNPDRAVIEDRYFDSHMCRC